MNEIIAYGLDKIWIIIPIIFIIGLVVPFIIIAAYRAGLKNSKGVLNKNTIILDSKMSVRLFSSIIFIFLLVIGLVVLFLALVSDNSMHDKIVGSIFGAVICIINLVILILILREYINVLTSKYAIVIDELKEKEYFSDVGSSVDNSLAHWALYFSEYFKKYNKRVTVDDPSIGAKYNVGDKFYLVFVKGNKRPYIFSANEYTLADTEKNNIKGYDDLNLKEFSIDCVNAENVLINKRRIKKEFNKTGHKKTAFVSILLCLILTAALIAVVMYFKNIIAIIAVAFFLGLFVLIAVTKIIYVCKINGNIRKNRITIKVDEVASLNNSVPFGDSNEIISFKFKNYKRLVFERKNEYPNVNVGDKFYLVFVKGDPEPIKVYKVDNSTVDSNIEIKD